MLTRYAQRRNSSASLVTCMCFAGPALDSMCRRSNGGVRAPALLPSASRSRCAHWPVHTRDCAVPPLQDPIPHASVAWALGDVGTGDGLPKELPEPLSFHVNSVVVKAGPDSYHVPLADSGVCYGSSSDSDADATDEDTSEPPRHAKRRRLVRS